MQENTEIDNEHIINSGRLDVGDGHQIYWIDWGNKTIKTPIFYLHGGPGAGFDEGDFTKFDPLKHRVVFHDQRGSSRSTPFASLNSNTSADLVSDITKLKDHLGFEKICLYGFSWGSTLALLYAIENPEVVEKMLIGGIFLARQADADYYLGGQAATHFPEAWERFASQVPKEKRSNIGAYYREKLQNGTEAERKKYAKEWMLYESSILRLDYVPSRLESGLKDFAAESLAYLEAHYILNGCFIDENFIIKNTSKIAHIPTVVVQGRYDFICLPRAANELSQALGGNSTLHMVAAGHSTSETTSREVIKAYSNSFLV